MSERARPPIPSDTPSREATTEPMLREKEAANIAEHTVFVSPHFPLADDLSQTHRLYLHDEWYVLVDKYGMVVGSCAEGALGYIVKLHSSASVPHPVCGALKIPRLRADTLEENAYVCQILKGEADSVFQALSSRVKDKGLIAAMTTRTAGFLRDPRALSRCADEMARAQHNCIPFIHFGKDQRLRICNVKFEAPAEGGKPVLRVFPPGLEKELSFLTYEDWQRFQEQTLPNSETRDHAFYFIGTPVGQRPAYPSSSGPSSANSCMGRLDQMLQPERPEDIWYAHLPSVLFEWADCTLQRALSVGWHRRWRLKEHYKLLQQVVKGLQTLHSKGIIHADVRPANVMALGDGTIPEHYSLSDYGSFTNDQANAGGAGGGFTTMPGVTRHRTSVFYARERRAGMEQENADVALIIGEPGRGASAPGYYFVRLGWKAEVIDEQLGRVYPEVISDMEQVMESMVAQRPHDSQLDPSLLRRDPWSLSKGDQIRLRDYVFKLIDSHDDDRSIQLHGKTEPQTLHCQDFLCDSRYTRVLLEKLAVRGGEFLFGDSHCIAPRDDAGVLVLDLPRWTELRQSSVASDLYSVGVMALYTVYTSACLNRGEHDALRNADSSVLTATPAPPLPDELEEHIAKLVRRLEDEKNFNELWLNLTRACTLLESALRSGTSVEQLLEAKLDPASPEQGPASATRVKDFIESVVESLFDHAEELRQIHQWSRNSAYFLLFVHFVLSCLHRGSHLDAHRMNQLRTRKGTSAEDTLGLENLLFPFCEDRCQRTGNNGEAVAKSVLDRLNRLLSYFDQKLFFRQLDSRLTPNKNGTLSPDEEVAGLQLQLRNLRSEKDSLLSQLRRRDDELRTLQKSQVERIHQLEQQSRKSLTQHSEVLQEDIKLLRQRLEEKQGELSRLKQTVRLHLPKLRADQGKNQGNSKNLSWHAENLFEHCRALWTQLDKLEGKLRNNKPFGNKMDEETAAGLLRLRQKHEQVCDEHAQINSSVDTLCVRIDSYDALDALLQEEVLDDTALHKANDTGEIEPITLEEEPPSKPGSDK